MKFGEDLGVMRVVLVDEVRAKILTLRQERQLSFEKTCCLICMKSLNNMIAHFRRRSDHVR